MIQPGPHDINDEPSEMLRLIYNTDPGARIPDTVEGMEDLPLMRGYLE